jgi:hypothetical protein
MSGKMPGLFDSMQVNKICKCKLCFAMWKEIDSDHMTDEAWVAYSGHLEHCHGWIRDEVEAEYGN